MKKLFLKIFFPSLIVVLLASCNGTTSSLSYVYQTDPQYTWGFAEFFGSYYSNYSIPENVVALNLFSDGLGIDTTENSLTGYGQYLILEDVFINSTDTFLAEGTYTAVDTITDIKPFTFLSGKAFEEKSSSDEISSGAYIYYLEENDSKSTIKYIASGTFTVTYDYENGTSTITCDFVTTDKTELKGTFTGSLVYYDESAEVKASVPRKSKFLLR